MISVWSVSIDNMNNVNSSSENSRHFTTGKQKEKENEKNLKLRQNNNLLQENAISLRMIHID